MGKDLRVRVAFIAAIAILATLVIGLAVGTSGTPAALSAPSVDRTVASVPNDPGQGPREAITVHGQWLIEVRNPDGSLADRREFENALFGPFLITAVLGRSQTTGPWALEILGGTQPCSPSGALFGCWISEPGTTPTPNPNNFTNLTVGFAAGTSSSADKLVLRGTFTVQQNGDITTVRSRLAPCAPTVAPASANSSTCGSGINNMSTVTSATITPVSVTTGQLVQITVTLSFS